MATYKSSSSDGSSGGRYYQLDVTFNGTGTVTAKLTSTGGSSDFYAVYNLYVKVGDTVLWDIEYQAWTTQTFPVAKGSATKTVTVPNGTSSVNVTFKGRPYTSTDSTTNNGGTFTLDWETYTVSYNANGGSGAPSNQTKTYGKTLTLSSTKPTRTGYAFKGWGTSSTDTTVDYSAGGSYTANASDTLYAIWTENELTVNYYSNGADYCKYEGTEIYKNQTQNIKVHSQVFKYNTSYSSGLSNIQNQSYLYMTKTGYSSSGNWGTSTSGGNLVDEDTSFNTGQALAVALGKTLANGNASVSVYAQWNENYLTVNYYSNYATEAFDGALNTVGADKNVVVRTTKYYYDNEYTNGQYDYSQSGSSTYLGRTGYTATGYWGTSENGGTLISQSTSYSSGQAVAESVGKSLKTGNATINLYPQWEINEYVINYNANRGIGNMDTQTVEWNELFTFYKNSFVREGYKFVGWNLCRNNDEKWYVVGQGWLTEDEIMSSGYDKKLYEDQLELTLDTSWIRDGYEMSYQEEELPSYTMYAVWEISGVIYVDDGITFEPYLAYIDNGTEYALYLAYVDNGTDWDLIS